VKKLLTFNYLQHFLIYSAWSSGDLTLKPGSYNVSLNWKKPSSNRYCVMHYVIYWLLILNGNSNSSTVSSEDNSFVIEELIACVGYEVSI